MDKLIHTSEGNLIEDDPFPVGRSVIRIFTGTGAVPAGAKGVILPPNRSTAVDYVRVDWGKKIGVWNTKKTSLTLDSK